MSKPVVPPASTELATGAIPASAGADAGQVAFATASHDILFEDDELCECDVCGAPLPDDDDDERGYGMRGSGMYMWTRGESVRFEKAPLCSSCASAIGMTALARWEIEEEEG
jgi:hypothetical protein